MRKTLFCLVQLFHLNQLIVNTLEQIIVTKRDRRQTQLLPPPHTTLLHSSSPPPCTTMLTFDLLQHTSPPQPLQFLVTSTKSSTNHGSMHNRSLLHARSIGESIAALCTTSALLEEEIWCNGIGNLTHPENESQVENQIRQG